MSKGKGIKTKATVKDVKALDKSAVAAERMKQAYIRTKTKRSMGCMQRKALPPNMLLIVFHLAWIV